MSRISKQIKVPTAIHQRSNINLGGYHVTTGNFMKPIVARAMELVPGQSIDLRCELFTRLESMVVPTFGRAQLRTKFFWVPFRTVMPGWNDFITDTPHVFDDGSVDIIPFTPFIRNDEIFIMFSDSIMSEEVNNDESYDFRYYDNSANVQVFRRFNALGRFAWNVLRQLGYGPVLTPGTDFSFSALQLLSYLKVYVDWFFPSQYANDGDSAWAQSLFVNDVPQDPGDSFLSSNDLIRIFRMLINVTYDPDYFTSAWDNPTGPNTGLSSNIYIKDITLDSEKDGIIVDQSVQSSQYSNDGTPYISASDYRGSVNISQYGLDTLKALTDYMKRHQLSGSRAMDRYLARFGVKLASEKLNRSIFIDEMTQQVQFGDVTSTASTDGAGLGDYAGKGLSYGDTNLSFSTDDEYGLFLCITTIMPDIQYYQGLDRSTLHMTRLDFYTPEFDAQGVQAISKSELFVPFFPDSDSIPVETINAYMRGIFGLTSRFAEYKKGQSTVSGDFVIPSRNVGLDSWHLFRDMSYLYPEDSNLQDVVHDISFLSSDDRRQYDRIFQNVNSNDDKFRIIYNFDISSSFPGSRLFDTYEFKDEDKSQKVSIDAGGTTVS